MARSSAAIRSSAALRPAQQARSRQTQERIVAAALRLFEQRGFAQTGVADIASDAGVSVGGFYARFAGKQALLDWFYFDFVRRLRQRARRLLDPQRWRGRGCRPIVAAYIAMAARGFRTHREVLRAVAVRIRGGADADFAARIQAVNRELHGGLTRLLLERRRQIGHPDAELAIGVGLNFVSAALREYILFAPAIPQRRGVPLQRLIQELTDAYCAYLRLSPADQSPKERFDDFRP
jgi:AcrR family transcriptional regulator